MNFLETYWTRKEEIAELFAEFPYTDKEREHTVGAWAHSNLTIPEIKFLTKHADKPELEDIKTRKDLKLVVQRDQLRKGIITK